MKFYILIIMMANPGEHIDHYLYDRMPFDNVEDCTHFSQTYWQKLTGIAEMKHRKEWGNMFCIPERKNDSGPLQDNDYIRKILNDNKKGI